MKYIKVFFTGDMPENIWEFFYQTGSFVRDGFGEYKINGFVNEYETATKKDKKTYSLESVEKCRKLDEYLISLGGEKNETVVIYHGCSIT